MAQPLVSFVVPTRNRVEWLPECLSGLLAQSVSDIEVIVVNDASTDGTRELLEEYFRADPRVMVVHNAVVRGAGLSRNIGNAMANAPWIGVCDDDDCYPQNRAEIILAFAKAHPEGAMMTAPYVRIDYFDKVIKRFEGRDFDEEAFKAGKGISFFCHPACAYRKADILEIGGYKAETKDKTDDLQLVEDWIAAGKKILYEPEHFLVMHRVLPHSVMSQMRGWEPEWVGA